MKPEEYDAWYRTPRGRWIGETEYRLLREALADAPDTSVLDVGCGTGYFARRLAQDGFEATGVDANIGMVDYARTHGIGSERYLVGDARRLAFPDRSFDFSIAIASLCFIREQEQALREMVRVTRRRIVLGLLNRHSLLYWQKGRRGGHGAYAGARWHTAREASLLLVHANLRNILARSAIYLPGGGIVARFAEKAMRRGPLIGGFLLVAADVDGCAHGGQRPAPYP